MVAFVVLRHPVTISVKDLINPDNFYIFDIHENRIRGGSELKQMLLGICNLNSILLLHVTSSYEFGVNALNTQPPFLNIISVFNHIKLNFTKLLLVIFQFLANFLNITQTFAESLELRENSPVLEFWNLIRASLVSPFSVHFLSKCLLPSVF